MPSIPSPPSATQTTLDELARQRSYPGRVHITPGGPTAQTGVDSESIAHRLTVSASVYAAVYLVVVVAGRASGAFLQGDGYSVALSNGTTAACILGALLLVALIRTGRLTGNRLVNAGLVFEVLAAFGIDCFLLWTPIAGEMQVVGTSWVGVWVVIFVLIVPTTPAKTLVAALAAASTSPILLWIAAERSGVTPSAALIMQYGVSNYICVAIAVYGSQTIYRMRQQVSQARAMGSYRLVEELGHGGMGEVWRAEHMRLARPAAIKLIRPSLLGGQDARAAETVFRRFEREAQATAALESPHTITLYDYGISDDGSFYYVMELLRGLDLQRMVDRFGPLPPARVAYLLRQACLSLQEAHGKGLIHRDIKPANIYACQFGAEYDFVKLLDFGLVKPVEENSNETGLTQAGTTTGTPAYMAPELALQKGDADARIDIYSLGCVAYWLLTGRLVFPSKGGIEMVMHHVQTEPTPPSEVSETPIPESLDRIVLACLAKAPSERPQSAQELVRHLDEAGLGGWNQEAAGEWWRDHLPDLVLQTGNHAASRRASF